MNEKFLSEIQNAVSFVKIYLKKVQIQTEILPMYHLLNCHSIAVVV
jgi:hypothetical protein